MRRNGIVKEEINLGDDFSDVYKKYMENKPVAWDDPYVSPKFENIKFDFTLDPKQFIDWLREIGEDITGNYSADVTSMCEHGCMYIAKVLKGKKLKGKLLIHYGHFGFWEHYWVGYIWKGQEYFVDLTLKQFIPDAPELAISKASNHKNGYNGGEGEDLYEYFLKQL